MFEENDKEHNAKLGFKTFAYALKNDNDEIVGGGIYGWKAFCEIYVDELCILKENRGLGYGKKLLEIVGKEVNEGVCANINLVTNSFQDTVGFYKKCGFEVEFIRKNTKDSKYDKYYMIKRL